ncbi:hypothetical protein [Geminisphaera colitermitum]|uniref:hypothetical protein n=1 Tax=Geminisphaera colitermitum TaxID=1148786 RepID=UPI000158CDBF|nr:hypothetical protein [Geminisphaera colitermitum]
MNSQFLPTAGSHHSVELDDTPKRLIHHVSLNRSAAMVQVQADGGDIRYTLDGNTEEPPSDTKGFILRDGDAPLVLSRAEADAMQVFGTGTLQLCQYSG